MIAPLLQFVENHRHGIHVEGVDIHHPDRLDHVERSLLVGLGLLYFDETTPTIFLYIFTEITYIWYDFSAPMLQVCFFGHAINQELVFLSFFYRIIPRFKINIK